MAGIAPPAAGTLSPGQSITAITHAMSAEGCNVPCLRRPPVRAAPFIQSLLQIIAGIIEERGIEVVFKGNHNLCHLLSFIARTGNTFVGSLLWVDFVRLCGMQKAATKAESH